MEIPLGFPDWRTGVSPSRRRRSAQSALSSLRRALASPAKAGLPGRLGPAALMEGVMLAAVFAVAPAHASQAPTHPALALNGVIHADSNGVINTDSHGVINTDGIQGTGA